MRLTPAAVELHAVPFKSVWLAGSSLGYLRDQKCVVLLDPDRAHIRAIRVEELASDFRTNWTDKFDDDERVNEDDENVVGEAEKGRMMSLGKKLEAPISNVRSLVVNPSGSRIAVISDSCIIICESRTGVNNDLELSTIDRTEIDLSWFRSLTWVSETEYVLVKEERGAGGLPRFRTLTTVESSTLEMVGVGHLGTTPCLIQIGISMDKQFNVRIVSMDSLTDLVPPFALLSEQKEKVSSLTSDKYDVKFATMLPDVRGCLVILEELSDPAVKEFVFIEIGKDTAPIVRLRETNLLSIDTFDFESTLSEWDDTLDVRFTGSEYLRHQVWITPLLTSASPEEATRNMLLVSSPLSMTVRCIVMDPLGGWTIEENQDIPLRPDSDWMMNNVGVRGILYIPLSLDLKFSHFPSLSGLVLIGQADGRVLTFSCPQDRDAGGFPKPQSFSLTEPSHSAASSQSEMEDVFESFTPNVPESVPSDPVEAAIQRVGNAHFLGFILSQWTNSLPASEGIWTALAKLVSECNEELNATFRRIERVCSQHKTDESDLQATLGHIRANLASTLENLNEMEKNSALEYVHESRIDEETQKASEVLGQLASRFDRSQGAMKTSPVDRAGSLKVLANSLQELMDVNRRIPLEPPIEGQVKRALSAVLDADNLQHRLAISSPGSPQMVKASTENVPSKPVSARLLRNRFSLEDALSLADFKPLSNEAPSVSSPQATAEALDELLRSLRALHEHQTLYRSSLQRLECLSELTCKIEPSSTIDVEKVGNEVGTEQSPSMDFSESTTEWDVVQFLKNLRSARTLSGLYRRKYVDTLKARVQRQVAPS